MSAPVDRLPEKLRKLFAEYEDASSRWAGDPRPEKLLASLVAKDRLAAGIAEALERAASGATS